jgi:hypothetical protein
VGTRWLVARTPGVEVLRKVPPPITLIKTEAEAHRLEALFRHGANGTVSVMWITLLAHRFIGLVVTAVAMTVTVSTLSPYRGNLSSSDHRRLLAVSGTAEPQRANVPNYLGERHHPDRDDLGPRTIAAHRPTRGPRRDGRHSAPRNRQDRALLPQQLGGDARGSARPLRRSLQARRSVESTAQHSAVCFIQRHAHRSDS